MQTEKNKDENKNEIVSKKTNVDKNDVCDARFFKNNDKSGYIIYKNSDKDEYMGELDKHKQPNGKGTMCFSNETVYIGEFKEGVPSGKGEYYKFNNFYYKNINNKNSSEVNKETSKQIGGYHK